MKRKHDIGTTDYRGRGQADMRSTRTPSEMQKQWRPPSVATRIAADIEEFGYGGSRVVLNEDQEVAIADVQRPVVAVRSGETLPMNSSVGRIAEQRQSGERSSESARV